MFTVQHSKYIDVKAALMRDAPNVLLFDGVPVLFTGRNKRGNYLIGSNVFDDLESGIERYFHIIVEPEDFRRFNAGFVNYLDLLRTADTIYVIDRNKRTKKEKVGIVDFAKIPGQNLPTEYSYFPRALHNPTIEYTTKIAGGPAEDHLAFPQHVGIIQNQVTQFLDKGLRSIRNRLGFSMETKLAPATASSYAINYVVSLSHIPGISTSEDQLLEFMNEFTEFCVDHLPTEIDNVIDLNLPRTFDARFEKLFDKAVSIVPMFGSEAEIEQERNELREDLRKDVLAVPPILAPVADIIRESYVSLEFDNKDLPLGTINQQFSDKLSVVLEKLDKVTVDDRVRSYTLIMYSYNKKSGIGHADVFIQDNKYAVRIHVLDFKENGGPYISSMAEDKLMTVQGLMTYKNAVPDLLEVS